MTTVWVTIVVLFAGTATIKAVGPATLGGRRPSGRATSVIALIAPALLSALVVYETLVAPHGGVRVDARIVGLAAAALALLRRLPMVAVVLIAAGATALARLVS
jgi:sorbitol-specific phosphotransferase system component IIC